MIFAFTGLHGVGKSSLIAALEEYYKKEGYEVEVHKELIRSQPKEWFKDGLLLADKHFDVFLEQVKLEFKVLDDDSKDKIILMDRCSIDYLPYMYHLMGKEIKTGRTPSRELYLQIKTMIDIVNGSSFYTDIQELFEIHMSDGWKNLDKNDGFRNEDYTDYCQIRNRREEIINNFLSKKLRKKRHLIYNRFRRFDQVVEVLKYHIDTAMGV
jgi:thymidylate kinase